MCINKHLVLKILLEIVNMLQLDCKPLIPLINCLVKINTEFSCQITEEGCKFTACNKSRTVYSECKVSPNVMTIIEATNVSTFIVNSISFSQVIQHFDSLYLIVEEDYINFKNTTLDTIFSLPQITEIETVELEYSKFDLLGLVRILPHMNWNVLLNSPILHFVSNGNSIELSTDTHGMETKINIYPHDCDSFESIDLNCLMPFPIMNHLLHLAQMIKKPINWYFQSGDPMVVSVDMADCFDLDVVISINEEMEQNIVYEDCPDVKEESTIDDEITTLMRESNQVGVIPRPLKKMKYK
eukprot:NODE_4_length_77007_cov_1.156642.p35 type:complete len:298 gc:universal NODE_4_length_77007_cov_1.156642:40111-41004(+)